jgi:hypothetical protein
MVDRDGDRGLRARTHVAQPGTLSSDGAKACRAVPPHVREADPGLTAAVLQAWMDAQAYALNTYMTASRLMAGGTIGVEASLNKIFWSELDVSLHRAAMSLLGARAELLPHAPGCRGPRELARGIHLLAGRPDLRRHERDPAQHHRRAAARAAARLTWTSPSRLSSG